MYIFYDTETTGLVNHKQPSHHPSQPHIVQLAAMLTTSDMEEVARLNCIIRPDGWEIPPSVTETHGISVEEAIEKGIRLPACDIHGITQEVAMKRGVPLVLAMGLFNELCSVADAAVAHNIDFDIKAVEAEYYRLGWGYHYPPVSLCTMKSTTELCQLPGKYSSYKWPKLVELHQFLFGEGFEGAHDAMVDIEALVRCFKELKSRGHSDWHTVNH